MTNNENRNRVRTSRKTIINGKTVEDETFEHLQIETTHINDDSQERPDTEADRIPCRKGTVGRLASLLTVIAGCLVLAFAAAPLLWNWFVVIAWLMMPMGAISLIAGVVCFFCKKKAWAVCGILLSILGVVIAFANADTYALAVANSINDVTSLAKAFIDALNNPFK